MSKLSQEFIAKLKLDSRKLYEIAQQANVDQTYLSKAINSIITVKPNDDRILRVADIIRHPQDSIFEASKSESKTQEGALS